MQSHTMLTAASIAFLQKALPKLQAIYLFGSQASGNATEQSDVDIAVLLPHPLAATTAWSLSAELAQQLNKDVDLVDLRQASVVFQHQVVTRGKRLWVAHPSLDANLFETMALREMISLNQRRQSQLQDIIQSGTVYGR